MHQQHSKIYIHQNHNAYNKTKNWLCKLTPDVDRLSYLQSESINKIINASVPV